MEQRFQRWRRKLEIFYGKVQIRRRGFWFIDIPRTSSSSIKAELGQLYGRAYSKLNIKDKGYGKQQIFADHLPAHQMREILTSDVWNSIFTFTIVRNPWDRLLSSYYYRKNRVKNLPEDMDFKKYVFELYHFMNHKNSPLFLYHGYYYSAAEYILDEKEDKIINFIGKYENREEDIRYIGEKLNIPKFGSLHIQKAREIQEPYSKFYDDEMAQMVGKLYEKDIKLFDYKFGED